MTLSGDLSKMLPPIIQQYLFTLIIPVILAAFFWMCVGVLDNQCRSAGAAEKKALQFTRNAHIGMGVFATLAALYSISKMLKAGNMKMPSFRRG